MKRYLLLIPVIFIINWFATKQNSNQDKYSELFQMDKPNSASFRDYVMMVNPQTAIIPFEKYPVAIKKINQNISLNRNQSTISWQQIQSDMGGRTKTVVFDPNDANGHKVWAGSATGGLWFNNNITDENSQWQSVSDVWEAMSISSICFDPNNPQIMYVGTGEYETAIVDIYRESSGRGYGIWKSTDGGQTFTHLSSTQAFGYISDIAIKNENSSSVIYAGVVSGRYRGTDFQAQPSEGLYKSVDGGITWQQVLPTIQGTNEVYAPSDIEITGNGRIFVGTKRNFNEHGGATILYSDTGLSGSWTVYDNYKSSIEQLSDFNIPARVKISSAPSNSNVVYCVIAAKSIQQTIEDFPVTEGKYLIKSNNGGQTWTQMNIPDGGNKNWAYLAWHALTISVDPTDENRIFAGGLDVHLSTDSGQTWNVISDWSAIYFGGDDNYVHADIHKIQFSPIDHSKLIISTDGGVFYTDNSVSQNIFFHSRNKNYTSLLYYSCAVSQTGQEMLLGGLQDNGTLLYVGSPLTESDMVMGGDGAFCAFDDDQGLLINSTYDNSFLIFKPDYSVYNYINDFKSGLFTTTFDYDSTNNTIWAIASDLHGNRNNELLRIDNVDQTYSGNFINIGSNSNMPFSAIHLIDNNTLLVGTANGKLYKSTNIRNNLATTQIDGGNFPTGFISCIQTADNGQKILVIISNYGVNSVWLSNDGGNTWINKEGNLPDMPIRWGIFHPQNDNQVMLATEIGIWTTNNLSASNIVWSPEANFPKVRVDMLDIRTNNNKVVAGTHGRTMLTGIWNVEANNIDINIAKYQIDIYPNPATEFFKIKNSNISNEKLVEIYNIQGKKIKEYKYKQDITYNINDLKKGIYIIKIGNYSHKLIVK